MPEKEFSLKLEKSEQEKPKETKEPLEKARDFFEEEKEFLTDYAGDVGLVFKKGEQWAINPETGEITYNPAWFVEKGYQPAENMVACLHEIEHFCDLRQEPAPHRENWTRIKSRQRLQFLHNVFEDALIAKIIPQRAPVYRDTLENLYQNRLFPEADFRQLPKHIQLVDALLRETVLPQEKCQVSPEVEKKIEELKNFKGKIDLIELVTTPGVKPKSRLQAIRRYIEPIYEELFQEDLKQKQKELEGKGEKGKKGEKGMKPKKIDEEVFAKEYKEQAEKFPHPISPEEFSKIAKEIEKIQEKAKKQEAGPKELNQTAYEMEHGVKFEDIEAYQREYEHIKPYIADLKEIFEKIIASRKEVRRRLKALKKEGALIEPGLLIQAYIDSKKDIFGSKVWRALEKREVETYGPNEFEVSLVCDLSGSMKDPMEKLIEQRRCTLLMMEVLKDFSTALDKEREEMALDLNVKSEVRAFTEIDNELKPLSPDLDEKTRIEVYKNLGRAPGEATNDFKSLRKIRENLDQETQDKLQEKTLRKVVIVFSDGVSSDKSAVQRELKILRDLGVTVVGLGITQEAEKIKETYHPEAKICSDVSQLPKTLKELLKNFFEEL